MIKKLTLAMVIAMGFAQCKTQTSSSTTDTQNQDTSLRTPISRGTIRVLAEIVEIKPINKEAGDTPCGKYPCEATIRIERVIDTGSNFEGEIGAEKSFDAYFVKTLVSTENVYPEMKEHLPGLKVKDKFQADIVYNQKVTSGSKYHVVDYQKQ